MAQAKVKSTMPAKRTRKAQLPVKFTHPRRLDELPPGRGYPDFRALTTFECLEPHHRTFLVREDGSAPHLFVGEYAVIDIVDREPQHGELYVVQHNSGQRRREIVQAKSSYCNITGPGAEESLVWWLCDLRGFRQTDEKLGGIPVFAGLSDGPYETAGLKPKLLGRVVGVAHSALGGLLARAAGWEDEDAGNVAFDPAEYIDALLAAGYGPSVYYRGTTPNGYMELMPEGRERKSEEAAVMAQRYKYAAASTALDRVVQECIRRGLVTGEGIVPMLPGRGQS
jgi:hypothetical protein